MKKFLAIGAFALFSMMVAGTAVAQERQVLQEGFQSSGTAGGVDDAYMRQLLVKPETIYGRLWGKDIPGGKIYVETGGGALVTVRLNEKANMENFKAALVGADVEIQAYRNMRRLGQGAFAADVPDGDPIALDISVLRAADNPTNLVPQAGYKPDTDRAINARSGSTLGGVGGQCFNCYDASVSGGTDYEKAAAPATAPKK